MKEDSLQSYAVEQCFDLIVKAAFRTGIASVQRMGIPSSRSC